MDSLIVEFLMTKDTHSLFLKKEVALLLIVIKEFFTQTQISPMRMNKSHFYLLVLEQNMIIQSIRY
jgi:hypothetical protein